MPTEMTTEPLVTKDVLTHAANWFEGIANGTEEPLEFSYGLCFNVYLYLNTIYAIDKFHLALIWSVIQRQAKQGDNPAYPIEGSEEAYDKNQDKYNPETEFGARRLEVARTVARILRNIVD